MKKVTYLVYSMTTYLKLEIEGKEIELDIADSKNLVAVNYEA